MSYDENPIYFFVFKKYSFDFSNAHGLVINF